MEALAQAPAVIAALLDNVDLLVQVLADVGGPEFAGLAIEGHPPDITQTISPDFRQSILLADERIVLGNGVILARVFLVNIDAQDLGQQGLEVLAIFEGIVGRAAVAQGNIQVAVRAETDGAAVVVPERSLDAQQHLLGGGIGPVRIVLADPEARQHIGPRRFLQGVKDEEFAGLFVIGVKRQSQKAFLVFIVVVAHALLNIEKNLGLVGFRVVWEDVDDAVLGGDKDPVGSVAGMGQYQWPKRRHLACIAEALPTGPFQIGESNGRLERHGSLVNFFAGHGGADGGHGAGLIIGNQDEFCRGIEADATGLLKAAGQEDRLPARPWDDKHLAVLGIANEKAAMLIPGHSEGEGFVQVRATNDLCGRAVRNLDPQQIFGGQIHRQQVRHAVHDQGRGEFHERHRPGLGNQGDFALGIDAVNGPVNGPFTTFGKGIQVEIACIGNVKNALLIDGNGMQMQQGRGKGLFGCEHASLSLRINSPDPLLVGHEQGIAKGDQALGIVQAGGKGNSLVLDDYHDSAIAVLVDFAHLGDVKAPVRPDRDRHGVIQAADQWFGQFVLAKGGRCQTQENADYPQGPIHGATSFPVKRTQLIQGFCNGFPIIVGNRSK